MQLNEEVIKFTEGIEIPKNLLSKEFKEFCKTENISAQSMFTYRSNVGGYSVNSSTIDYEKRYYNRGSLNKGFSLATNLLFFKLYKEEAYKKLGKRALNLGGFINQDIIDFLEIDFPKELIGDSDLVKLFGFMPFLVHDKRSKYYEKNIQKIFEEL